jgi:ubiquinone/menaquinone biosynthesis C-methylase UbiE
MSKKRLDPLDQWNIQYMQKGFDRANFFLSWIQKYFLLSEKKVLDLGCGQGYHSIQTSKIAQEVLALDIGDRILKDLKVKLHCSKASNISLVRADATHLPFKPQVFDAVLSYDLYEHVKNQQALLDETFGVVKTNGCVIFSTGNKIFPRDRHTGLWFVDYLPEKLANFYVRACRKRNVYDVYQPTYWSIKRKLAKQSSYYLLDGEFVLKMIKEVYPKLFRRFRWFAPLLESVAKMGIFKFLTPKFFVIALKT